MRKISYLAKVKTTKMIEGEKGIHYEVSASVAELEKGDHDFEKIAITMSYGDKDKMLAFPVGSHIRVKVEATQQRLDEPVEEPAQQSLDHEPEGEDPE